MELLIEMSEEVVVPSKISFDRYPNLLKITGVSIPVVRLPRRRKAGSCPEVIVKCSLALILFFKGDDNPHIFNTILCDTVTMEWKYEDISGSVNKDKVTC